MWAPSSGSSVNLSLWNVVSLLGHTRVLFAGVPGPSIVTIWCLADGGWYSVTVSVSSGPQQQRLQHDLLVLVTVECSAVLTIAWASHSLVGWLAVAFLH